jgi:hypothetical protein
MRPDNYATPWQVSGVGTNAGVTATKASPGGTKTLFCTGIQCSGDAAAVVTVESPASTVLYRKRFAAAFTISERFDMPLKGAVGQDLLVKVSASTSNSEAGGQGYVA